MAKTDDLGRFTGIPPQKGQYSFSVKDLEDGTFWIFPEPAGDTLKIMGPKGDDLGIGFMLRPETTFEEARELARHMNRHITDIALFEFHRPEDSQ